MTFKKIEQKLLILFFLFFFCPPTSFADSQIKLSSGQTVYVPVYSNVFSGSRALPFNLAVMLSIRNIDPHHSMTVISVQYYDNDGNFMKNFIKKPLNLGPLASHDFFIKENDEAGGFGANFIVRWEATKRINTPIIETVMIGARSGQGISFIGRGQVITEKTE